MDVYCTAALYCTAAVERAAESTLLYNTCFVSFSHRCVRADLYSFFYLATTQHTCQKHQTGLTHPHAACRDIHTHSYNITVVTYGRWSVHVIRTRTFVQVGTSKYAAKSTYYCCTACGRKGNMLACAFIVQEKNPCCTKINLL